MLLDVPRRFLNDGEMENEESVLWGIAEAITEARTKRGLSRNALAKLAGIDVKTIASVEQATRWPQDTNRRKICQALGLSPRFMDYLKDGIVSYDEHDSSEIAESAYEYGIKSEDLVDILTAEALQQLRILERSHHHSFPDEDEAEQAAERDWRYGGESGPGLRAASDAELLAEIAQRFSRTAPPGNTPLPADYYDLAAHPKTDSPGVREHAAGMERGEESQDFPDD